MVHCVLGRQMLWSQLRGLSWSEVERASSGERYRSNCSRPLKKRITPLEAELRQRILYKQDVTLLVHSLC